MARQLMQPRDRAESRAPQLGEGNVPAHLRQDSSKLPLLTVIAPARNEAGNAAELVRRLERVAANLPMEIVFVDDSDDDTAEVVSDLRRRSKCPIKLITRPNGQRKDGLGGAVVAGEGQGPDMGRVVTEEAISVSRTYWIL